MNKLFRTGATLGAIAACALLTGAAHAETLVWSFDNVAVGNPTSVAPSSPTPSSLNYVVSGLSRGNNLGNGQSDNQFINTVAASGTGFSGVNNASQNALAGALNYGTSAFFGFSATPNAGDSISSSAIVFGSRSSGTGPTDYVFAASTSSDFSNPTLLATGKVNAPGTSSYRLNTSTGTAGSNQYNYQASAGQTVYFRLYGFGGTGSTGATTSNWRIDDLQVSVPIPEPGTFALALMGVGPLGVMAVRRRKAMRK